MGSQMDYPILILLKPIRSCSNGAENLTSFVNAIGLKDRASEIVDRGRKVRAWLTQLKGDPSFTDGIYRKEVLIETERVIFGILFKTENIRNHHLRCQWRTIVKKNTLSKLKAPLSSSFLHLPRFSQPAFGLEFFIQIGQSLPDMETAVDKTS